MVELRYDPLVELNTLLRDKDGNVWQRCCELCNGWKSGEKLTRFWR